MSLFKSNRFSVTAALLLLAGLLHAEEPLAWQDCFSKTVENNIDLSVAKLKLKEAEAALKSQESVYYPEVSAGAGVGNSGTESDRRTSGSGTNKTVAGGDWENGHSWSTALAASYTIFDGFGDRARVTQKEAELYAEKANFDQTCSNIEYDLRKAFSDQLYAQELLDLMTSIAARRADNTRLVEMRYEGGREHKGSLMLKQAQLSEALYGIEEAKRTLELARRRLAGMMKQTVYPDFTVVGELRTNSPPVDVSLDELARRTPSYHSAEANIKAAEQGFIITRSERFPKVTAAASLTESNEKDVTKKEWKTGIAVSLPLFTGWRISQDIIISGLKREQSRLDAENTMLDLLNNLQGALNTYRNSYGSMSVQKEQLDAADTRATVARAQYQQGLISFQDWDTIENAWITAQRNWLLSRKTTDQAAAAWQNAMGLSSIH